MVGGRTVLPVATSEAARAILRSSVGVAGVAVLVGYGVQPVAQLDFVVQVRRGVTIIMITAAQAVVGPRGFRARHDRGLRRVGRVIHLQERGYTGCINVGRCGGIQTSRPLVIRASGIGEVD